MLNIIYGKEALLRKEELDKVRSKLGADGSLATNTATFAARTSSPQEVMGACDTLPFLGDSRLVIVEGVFTTAGRASRRTARSRPQPEQERVSDEAEADSRDESDPGAWLALKEYVPRMPGSTTLVLLDSDVQRSNPLLKALAPLGEVISCSPPADRDLSGWVAARAKKLGVKLDSPAAKLLAGLIGPDLWMLNNELEKLKAYAGAETVRDKDVRELVSRAKEHKGWDLTDAILEGSGATAARVLNEMLEDGTHPQAIIGMIAQRYRRAAVILDMLARGESGSAIMRQLGIEKTFALDRAIEQAQRLSIPSIRKAYARLIEAELDVKSRSIDDQRLALELAVHELASRPPAVAQR